MKAPAKYKTKRFACWNKAKELRLQQYLDVASAKEQGKLLVTGCGFTPYAMLSGFGDYVYFSGEPYGASAASDIAFSSEAMKAFEAKGFAQEMCSYMRNYVGSMYIDKYLFTGGPFPRPDFIWSVRHCPCGHPKWHTLIAEHFDIPIYTADDELHHQQSGRMQPRRDYVVGQLLDSIEWMEKLTGKTFDDEKAIKAIKNWFDIEVVWGEINLLNRAVPAPVDFKTLMAIVPIQMEMRGQDRALEFLKEFRDEVQDRVDNQIAAVANERYRLAMHGIPPWSTLKIFRKMEDYGVAFVSSGVYVDWAKLNFCDDGTITPAKYYHELGWPEMKNREDMVKTYVRWKTEQHDAMMRPLEDSVKYRVQLFKYLKVDGAVLNIDRGCPPANLGLLDYKIAFTEAGMPNVMMESNHGDYRENDETAIMQVLSTFLECQGIDTT
jgi:benzoyl-CoA reductase subunit B